MRQALFFGDSNTWGFDPETGLRYAAQRFPRVAAAWLGDRWTVIEEGLPGRTIAFDDPVEGVEIGMNGAAVLPALLRSHEPLDVVVLMLGTNDLKRRFALAPIEIAQAMERVVRLARSPVSPGLTPRIVLLAPAPIVPQGVLADLFSDADTRSRALAPLYRDIASRYACTFLDTADYWSVSPIDGIHFDPAMHARLGEAVAAAISAIGHDTLQSTGEKTR